MLHFAANLSFLYNDLAFLERFAAASKDGFKGVEYLFPYEFDSLDLAKALKDNGLQQVLFNAPPGGTDRASMSHAWEQGVRGTTCLPGHEAEFRSGFLTALAYAEVMNCPRIHVMAGLLGLGHTHASNHATYVNNLKWAAALAAKQGLDVLIEPINTRDIPGFYLNRQDQAHSIIEEVGASNLKVQMDLYHCQIVEGDVAMKIRQYLPTGRVGHFQIAGVPERHEPDIGEVNYPYLFNVIDEVSKTCNWQGWVGCEYKPKLGGQAGGTSAGLGWLAKAD